MMEETLALAHAIRGLLADAGFTKPTRRFTAAGARPRRTPCGVIRPQGQGTL